MGAREYDPKTRRWLQRERLPLADGHPNLYLFAGNDPLNLVDANGFASDYKGGHHIVPKQVFKDAGLPDEAYNVLINALTGPIPGGHRWDADHAAYNKAVKQLWDKWIKDCGIDPSKMTSEQALQFVMKVMRDEDKAIREFLSKIASQQGISTVQMKLNVLMSIFTEGEWALMLKHGLDTKRLHRIVQKIMQNELFQRFVTRVIGRAASKANVLITVGAFLITAFQEGIIAACNETLWPVSELWSPEPIRALLGE